MKLKNLIEDIFILENQNDPTSCQKLIQSMDQIVEKSNPIKMEICICSICNQDCKHCSNDSFKKNEYIDIDKIKKIVDANPGYIIITGGEPCMHPHFIDILLHTKSNNAFLKICTNGSLLNPDLADKISKILDEFDIIQISFDSYNENIYRQIRGVNHFKTIIENIKYIKKTHQHLKIELHCVPTQYNWFDLINIYLFACELNVDIFSVAPLAYMGKAYTLDYINPVELLQIHKQLLLVSQNQKTIYSGRPFEFSSLYSSLASEFDEKIYPKIYTCSAGRNSIYINSMGNIYPCVYLQYPSLCIGNVSNGIKNELNKAKVPSLLPINITVDKHSPCYDCNIWELCKGSCIGLSYNEINKLVPGYDYRCSKTYSK